MKHIISATTLTSGAQLSMCGHVLDSFDAAVADGHRVGNYMQQHNTLSAYHAAGVDCETCAVNHSHALGRPGIQGA